MENLNISYSLDIKFDYIEPSKTLRERYSLTSEFDGDAYGLNLLLDIEFFDERDYEIGGKFYEEGRKRFEKSQK